MKDKTLTCSDCGQEFDKYGVELPDRPECEACGGLLRPGVVWFGEMLPPEALAKAQRAAESCQAMLVAGTSSLVQPAASMAYWAKSGGALIVEINLERTPLSDHADECLFGQAGTILPQLVQKMSP